jgi:hypothetical protein
MFWKPFDRQVAGRTHVSAKNCRVFRAYTASNAIANWKTLGILY